MDRPLLTRAKERDHHSAIYTAGRKLHARNMSPTKMSTKGADHRVKNTTSIATSAHKRGESTHNVDRLCTSRFSSQKAGHQTTLVCKAIILNRPRLNIQQNAAPQDHDRLQRVTLLAVMNQELQFVTDKTDAIFPGRSEDPVPKALVPKAWQPYTTASVPATSSILVSNIYSKEPDGPKQHLRPGSAIHLNALLPSTSIMTPLAGADEDEASFPNADLDSRYVDTSDDDKDGVYADFGVLFGDRADSPDGRGEGEQCYEEYLDKVDRIICSS